MKLYITAASAFVLLVFYLPVVLLLLRRIVKSERLGKVAKVAAISVFLIVAYAIPLGDVTLNSIAMAKVCPKAGLHIYKQVKVEGYITSYGNERLLELSPYQYIEVRLKGGLFARFERSTGGGVLREDVIVPKANYEVVNGQWTWNERKRVKELRRAVYELRSRDLLAERLMFAPAPGWLDRIVVLRTFGGAIAGCSGLGPLATPIEQGVLLPK